MSVETIYLCDEHGFKTAKCCKEAEKTGTIETPDDVLQNINEHHNKTDNGLNR